MKIKINSDINHIYGKMAREQVAFYNNLTRKICDNNQVDFINLDSLISKDSNNFIDFIHLNNKGCKRVAETITPELIKILRRDNVLN